MDALLRTNRGIYAGLPGANGENMGGMRLRNDCTLGWGRKQPRALKLLANHHTASVRAAMLVIGIIVRRANRRRLLICRTCVQWRDRSPGRDMRMRVMPATTQEAVC